MASKNTVHLDIVALAKAGAQCRPIDEPDSRLRGNDNVSLYYTQNGRRITIKYVDAPVAKNQWHTLRVEFAGTHIRVALDGKIYIEAEDAHIAGPGRVGVWTKGDAVTLFDGFTYGPAERK